MSEPRTQAGRAVAHLLAMAPVEPDGTDAGALANILDEAKGGGWKPEDGTSLWFYNAAGDQIHLTGDDVALLLHAALAEAAASPAALDVRPQVASFALLMERVLRDNDHKGGWRDCRPSWLLARLKQEVGELDETMRKGTIARRDLSGRTAEWPADVAREAADVANFAMMIVDVLAAQEETQA